MCCVASNIRCDMTGTIFDIKEFTVHDGPGSRITVFLKGCPLRCKWCHNPEGLRVERQLLYRSNFCSHCGRCYIPCDHPECQPFQRCIHACVNGCLTVAGEDLTSEELSQRLLENATMLNLMGGGITISGGEPMLQADFVCELTQKLSDSVHLAIQTSGYAKPETYRRVIQGFDYVMQDIKLADGEAHKKFTGVSNDNILENIAWLKTSGKEFVFRVPLIPGITDTEENLQAISRIAGDCRVELMPYNEFAGAKYTMLGMEYTLGTEKNRSEDFTRFFQNAIMRA